MPSAGLAAHHSAQKVPQTLAERLRFAVAFTDLDTGFSGSVHNMIQATLEQGKERGLGDTK